jgi:hypothetical protein
LVSPGMGGLVVTQDEKLSIRIREIIDQGDIA